MESRSSYLGKLLCCTGNDDNGGIDFFLNLLQHFDRSPFLTLQMILGSWLNMVGAVVRVCGTLSGGSYTILYPVVMLGQTLGALAQPLIVFTPTKQAALWFPDHQRATANMIATMCE